MVKTTEGVGLCLHAHRGLTRWPAHDVEAFALWWEEQPLLKESTYKVSGELLFIDWRGGDDGKPLIRLFIETFNPEFKMWPETVTAAEAAKCIASIMKSAEKSKKG